jgi:EAL domain-containing protein (putative c-di-GMP-specific phosphodiesterase class I)
MHRRGDPAALEQSAQGDFAGGVYSHRRRHNLIIPLTRYVIAETARQLDAFPPINIFTFRLMSPPPFGELLRDLHKLWFSAYPVQQLVVELTERDVLQDGDHHMAEHLHLRGAAGYR